MWQLTRQARSEVGQQSVSSRESADQEWWGKPIALNTDNESWDQLAKEWLLSIPMTDSKRLSANCRAHGIERAHYCDIIMIIIDRIQE